MSMVSGLHLYHGGDGGSVMTRMCGTQGCDTFDRGNVGVKHTEVVCLRARTWHSRSLHRL